MLAWESRFLLGRKILIGGLNLFIIGEEGSYVGAQSFLIEGEKNYRG